MLVSWTPSLPGLGQLIAAVLLTGGALACRTPHKVKPPVEVTATAQPSTPLSKPTPPQKVDAKTLNPLQLIAQGLPLGNQRMLLLKVLAPRYGDYFKYAICPPDRKGACVTGELLAGARLVPNLAAGDYDISLAACLRPERAASAAICGDIATTTYHQEAFPKNGLTTKIAELQQISAAIKAFGPKVQTALAKYRQASYGSSLPSSDFDQQVAMQLALGPYVSSELVNSATFKVHYARLKKALPTPPAVASSSEEEAREEEAREEEAREEEAWKQYIDEHLPPTTGPVPAQDNSNANPLVNSVLINLGGTAGVVLGVLITKFGYLLTQGADLAALAAQKYPPALLLEESMNKALDLTGRMIHSFAAYQAFQKVDDLPPAVRDQLKIVTGLETLRYHTDPSGKLTHLIEGLMVYKAGTSLAGLDGLRPGSHRFISASDWAALPLATQVTINGDYVRDPASGARRLKEIWRDHYFDIEGALYRKSWPELQDHFPKLSADTLIRLNQRYTRLNSDPNFLSAEKALLEPTLDALADQQGMLNRIYTWAKPTEFNPLLHWAVGEPLFDLEGRLVEPPDDWKIPGRNWPVPGSDLTFKINGKMQTFAADNRLNNLNRTYEPAVAFKNQSSLAGLTNKALGPEAALWRTEISLKTMQKDWGAKISATNKPLHDLVTTKTLEMRRGGQLLMAAGTFVGLAGMATILTDVLLNLSSSPALERLLLELTGIEDELFSLHSKRLSLWQQMQGLLTAEEVSAIGDGWLYEL